MAGSKKEKGGLLSAFTFKRKSLKLLKHLKVHLVLFSDDVAICSFIDFEFLAKTNRSVHH
jgi:hypothetical protein